MNSIKIENAARDARPQELGVAGWSIWEKEVSRFPWRHGASETCYLLEGEVLVTPVGGEAVRLGKGNLVTFPAGLSCVWEIRVPVREHYRLG